MKETRIEYFEFRSGTPTPIGLHFFCGSGQERTCEAPIRKGRRAGNIIMARESIQPERDNGIIFVGIAQCTKCDFKQYVALTADGSIILGDAV